MCERSRSVVWRVRLELEVAEALVFGILEKLRVHLHRVREVCVQERPAVSNSRARTLEKAFPMMARSLCLSLVWQAPRHAQQNSWQESTCSVHFAPAMWVRAFGFKKDKAGIVLLSKHVLEMAYRKPLRHLNCSNCRRSKTRGKATEKQREKQERWKGGKG